VLVNCSGTLSVPRLVTRHGSFIACHSLLVSPLLQISAADLLPAVADPQLFHRHVVSCRRLRRCHAVPLDGCGTCCSVKRTAHHQSKTGYDHEFQRFCVLTPFIQHLAHDKNTNEQEAAKVEQMVCEPIRSKQKNDAVELFSFQNTCRTYENAHQNMQNALFRITRSFSASKNVLNPTQNTPASDDGCQDGWWPCVRTLC
jgi:hypothetical protein